MLSWGGGGGGCEAGGYNRKDPNFSHIVTPLKNEARSYWFAIKLENIVFTSLLILYFLYPTVYFAGSNLIKFLFEKFAKINVCTLFRHSYRNRTPYHKPKENTGWSASSPDLSTRRDIQKPQSSIESLPGRTGYFAAHPLRRNRQHRKDSAEGRKANWASKTHHFQSGSRNDFGYLLCFGPLLAYWAYIFYAPKTHVLFFLHSNVLYNNK